MWPLPFTHFTCVFSGLGRAFLSIYLPPENTCCARRARSRPPFALRAARPAPLPPTSVTTMLSLLALAVLLPNDTEALRNQREATAQCPLSTGGAQHRLVPPAHRQAPPDTTRDRPVPRACPLTSSAACLTHDAPPVIAPPVTTTATLHRLPPSTFHSPPPPPPPSQARTCAARTTGTTGGTSWCSRGRTAAPISCASCSTATPRSPAPASSSTRG